MSTIKHRERTEKDFQKLPIAGNQPKDEKEEKFLREICEYEFMNLEEAGVSHKFSYGNTKNSHTFTLFHGGKYRLPRFLARHIESCSTPIWKWIPKGDGTLDKEKVGTKPRFQMRQSYGG